MAHTRRDVQHTPLSSSVSQVRADCANSIPPVSADARKTAIKRRNLAIQYFARSSTLRASPRAEMEVATVARTVKAPQPIVVVKKIRPRGKGRQDSTASTFSEDRSASPQTSRALRSLPPRYSGPSLSPRSRADSAVATSTDMLSPKLLGRRELQAMFSGASVFSVENDRSGFIPRVARYEKMGEVWASDSPQCTYDSPQSSPSSSSASDHSDQCEPGSLTFEQFLRRPLEESSTNARLNFARRRLLHTKPAKLGLRSVASDDLLPHLTDLGCFYQQLDARKLAAKRWRTAEIDQLGDELFSTLLSPLKSRLDTPEVKKASLSCQIEALQGVLNENHMWYDLSLPESQLKIGQAIWADYHDEDDDADRTVLLLQLVLAAELFVRFRILECISAEKCELVQSQQSDKINWDLVITEQFLAKLDLRRQSSLVQKKKQRNCHSVLGMPTFLEAVDAKSRTTKTTPTAAPDFSEQQLDDICTFAEEIGWPDRKESSLCQETYIAKGWMGKTLMTCWDLPLETMMKLLMGTLLENDPEATDLLKPMPDWSTGFSLGGKTFWSDQCIVGRVMATGPGSRQSLSWISTPTHDSSSARWLDVECEDLPDTSTLRINQAQSVARDSHPTKCGSEELVDRDDFTIPTNGPKTAGDDVQFDGLSFEPSLRRNTSTGSDVKTEGPFNAHLAFSSPVNPEQDKVTIPLRYNVYFVSSHACCARRRSTPPTASQMTRGTDLADTDRSSLTPPAHPLHKDYSYHTITAMSLLTPDPQARLNLLRQPIMDSDDGSTSPSTQATLILDARGPSNLSLLARAWCAETGSHALLSQTTRTCLACSIREARALAIGVVIRT